MCGCKYVHLKQLQYLENIIANRILEYFLHVLMYFSKLPLCFNSGRMPVLGTSLMEIFSLDEESDDVVV